MRWSEFEQRQSRLAERARTRLIDPGVVLVATIRRDGSPRISPVEPYLLDGEFWLAMMWQSHKARDLECDPRVLVHSIVASRDGIDGEIKIRGAAVAEHDPAMQQRYADSAAETLGWRAEVGRFHLFALDIHDVVSVYYKQPSGDQHIAIWPPGRESVRRATSATSVGEPEALHDLLEPE